MPAAIKAKGTLTVASDASYAPDEFIGSTARPSSVWTPDLMNALGKVMGLKVTIANVTFDDIIPGMVAGRYMLGASSFTDDKGAREAGQLRRLRQRRRVVLHADVAAATSIKRHQPASAG